MTDSPPHDPSPPRPFLLRAIRNARGLKACEVAQAMGLPLRTYRDFERRGWPARPDRLRAFAAVTDCDYAALLLSAANPDGALAFASLNNKGVTLAVGMLEDLESDLNGGLSTLTAADLIGAFDMARRHLAARVAAREPQPSSHLMARDLEISQRQLDCLRWAQAGKSSADIGVILRISQRTVESHLVQICRRLGVRTRVQAICVAIELGLISSRPP